MPLKPIDISINDLVLRYLNGESEKALAESLSVSRSNIRKRLTDVGVEMRGRGEAMSMRMAQSTPEERARWSAAAHDAVRGMKRTSSELEARARTRERKQLGNISPAEVEFAEMLRTEGLDVTHQKAIGTYNVDITTGSVGVEVLGGSWHRVRPHGERLRYLLDSGWDMIYIWVDRVHFPLGSGAAQYVVAHTQFRERYPAGTRCYRVIRGTGQFLAGGSADGDDIPDILPNSDRPDVEPAEVPFGLCHCGCGGKTTISNRNHARLGWVTGQPKRYITGHNRSRDSR